MLLRSTTMEEALELAEQAATAGEVPVGAIILGPSGERLAARRNEMRGLGDATAHAELLAIRDAMKALGSERLEGCDLYLRTLHHVCWRNCTCTFAQALLCGRRHQSWCG